VVAFNSGDYLRALDEFEVPYHVGDPARRELYLGLIRAAAALHHFGHGHPTSALRLGDSARALLAPWAGKPERAHGLDLGLLLNDLDRALAPLRGAAPGAAALLRPGFPPELRRGRI
jgi:hypothetical protein